MLKHDWKETGVKRKHVDGLMFRYETPVVTYLKCTRCGQMGYRRPGSPVIYTWRFR